jgi:uncharacterized RDD family membrane protein YckC
MMFLKNHVIKCMAMDGVIFALVLFSFSFLILIALLMVGMLNGAFTGKRVGQDFAMVMMGYQVVSQEG